MIRERYETKTDPITQPVDVVKDVLPPLVRYSDRELFVVIHLNTRNQPLSVEIVSTGSLNAAYVSPKEVFRAAILNASASIILAHNHPGGGTEPSRTDIELTRRLKQAGDIMDIVVLDHVIVAGEKHLSMKEAGLL